MTCAPTIDVAGLVNRGPGGGELVLKQCRTCRRYDAFGGGKRFAALDVESPELMAVLLKQIPALEKGAGSAFLQTPSAGVIRKLAETGPDITRWRRLVLDEVAEMKEDMRDEIDEWYSSLPDFVRRAYKESQLCVPLFIALLRKFGYPDADQLEIHLSKGFWMRGERWEEGTMGDGGESVLSYYSTNMC